MADVGNSLRVPHFLSASTPQGLMRVMFQNNLKDGMEYRYFDISFDGSKWIVWFFKIAEVKEIMAPQKKGNK